MLVKLVCKIIKSRGANVIAPPYSWLFISEKLRFSHRTRQQDLLLSGYLEPILRAL
jgi:hypothetical protein